MTSPAPAGKHAPSSPGPFIRLWLGVVALLALTILPLADGLFLPWPNDPAVVWLQSLWPRKRLLAEVTPSGPRLLILSGSSALFSVDAELLQARLGRPVVNLGTHAGVGLRGLLEQARETARPGDTLLLCLEDAHYRRDSALVMELEQKLLWTLHPGRIWGLGWPERLQELYGHPAADYMQGWQRRNAAMSTVAGAEEVWPTYSAVELSPQGDYRGRTVIPGPQQELPAVSFEPLRAIEPVVELERFFHWCQEHRITLLSTLPAAMRLPPGSGPDQDVSVLRDFYERRGIPFLHDPALDRLPRALMLDSRFHVGTAGRRIVTESLARALGTRLGSPTLPAQAPWLLVASPFANFERELVLAQAGVSACRFLSEEDLPSPLAVRPAEVRAARLAGQRIVFADPEIAPLLASAGLSSALVAEKSSTLAEWIAAYPRHLLAFVVVNRFETGPLAEGLPEPFRSFLASPARARVGVFGTGPYAGWTLLQEDRKTALLLLPETHPWQSRLPSPVAIALRSSNNTWPYSMVIGHCAIDPEAQEGLAVAVLDPATGRLVKHGVFTGPRLVEWQLQEVQLPTP